ncbi:MAG TPA: succinylglutamate desuccinylase/aspartoacylase family protein [Bryobacteraceae bacterium]|nr:succinylglutamate desuccinylase/aspartoacylase family protein [Bryobacteraceae bacterium]
MTELIHDVDQIDFDRAGKHHYQVAFHLDSAWGYSLVPLTVINGTRAAGAAGSAVAVFGGTHGNEYEGQIAVKRLCRELAAEEISGRVILIPQLSESACRAGTRVSPLDGVNMNRAFPGSMRGTLSYRISNFVKTRVFPLVSVVIDLHSGGNEAVFSLCTSIHRVPDPQQQREMIEAARLFDTPFIFIYSRQMASGLLTDEAEDEGKIAIGGEFGYAEGSSPRGVRHAFEGVRNVLRRYGLLAGEVTRVAAEGTPPPRLVAAPDLKDYIPCPRDGVWEPLMEPGADVSEGQPIGRIHDFADHASDPLEIRAHRAGVIIAQYFPAVCRKGLTLFVIAQDFAL